MKKLNVTSCSKIYFKTICRIYDKSSIEECDILPIYEESHEISRQLFTMIDGVLFKVVAGYIDYVAIFSVYFHGYKYGFIVSDSEFRDKIDVEICCLGEII